MQPKYLPSLSLKYIVFRIFQELRKEWRRILDEKYNVSEKKRVKFLKKISYLDFSLNVFYCVRGFDVKGYGFSCESFDEYLLKGGEAVCGK